MKTPLYTKLKDMRQRMELQHKDIIEALNAKGVVVDKIDNAVIASLIRQIYQSEWEFFFNFKDVDQFGQPHTLQSGQATGGLTLIKPYMADIVKDPVFDLTHTCMPILPVVGSWGYADHLTPPIELSIDDFTTDVIFDFKNEPVIAEELNYYDDANTLT